MAGYLLLLVLLGTIVSLVWLEYRKMEVLNRNELHFEKKRKAINRTFENLLDFSFSDDFLLFWDNSNFDKYRMKREAVTCSLNELKQYYSSDIQCSQINEVSSLLLEKDILLSEVINALSNFSRADSLLQKRIPVIASQTLSLTNLMTKKNGVVSSDCSKRKKNNLLMSVRRKNCFSCHN